MRWSSGSIPSPARIRNCTTTGSVAPRSIADGFEVGRSIGHVDTAEEAPPLELHRHRSEQSGSAAVRLHDGTVAVVPGDEIVDRLEGRALPRLAGAEGRLEVGLEPKIADCLTDRVAQSHGEADREDSEGRWPSSAEAVRLEDQHEGDAEKAEERRHGGRAAASGEQRLERHEGERENGQGRRPPKVAEAPAAKSMSAAETIACAPSRRPVRDARTTAARGARKTARLRISKAVGAPRPIR